MGLNVLLLIMFCTALLVIIFLVTKLRRVRGQLSIIEEALEDIKSGNLNRRMLAKRNDMTRKICYDINEIAMNSQTQLIRQKQSEQAYKRLMTSISHDVKTPLASLVGYLEAIECKIVAGEEKDEYVHVAFEKAHDIPETEYLMCIDVNAYSRILNNLLQNVLIHSKGSKMTFHISENDLQVKITIADNGKGISPDHLPHIFERMYQCDQSRSAKGNGLGLSIVKELVAAHKGTIAADSTPNMGTIFTILFPKSL